MSMRTASYSGFCPVNLEDYVTAKLPGHETVMGEVTSIRTIHEITKVNARTFFEIEVNSKPGEWISVTDVMCTSWTEKGIHMKREFDWSCR